MKLENIPDLSFLKLLREMQSQSIVFRSGVVSNCVNSDFNLYFTVQNDGYSRNHHVMGNCVKAD